MAGKVIELVREHIVPIIEGMGFDVVDVEYKMQRDKCMHLAFYIAGADGVSLDDCERVHNAVDAPLDGLDPTDGASYTLDISSPGLDRPFKTERDYLRNTGKEVEVSLYAPMRTEPDTAAAAGKTRRGGARARKVFTGVLTGFDGAAVTISADGRTLTFPLDKVAAVRQAITFR